MKKLLLFMIGILISLGAYGREPQNPPRVPLPWELNAAKNDLENLRNLPSCQGSDATKWSNCFGAYTHASGAKYVGEFKDGKYHGRGTLNLGSGTKYVGEWRNGSRTGQGTYSFANGRVVKGIRADDEFVRAEKIGRLPVRKSARATTFDVKGALKAGYSRSEIADYLASEANFDINGARKDGYSDDEIISHLSKPRSATSIKPSVPPNNLIEDEVYGKNHSPTIYFDSGPKVTSEDSVVQEERRKLEADRRALVEDRRRLDEEKRNREQARQSSKLSLQATTTIPDANGAVIVTVRTNTDTSSLKVNGEEQGGKPDGNYVIKKIARVGQDTQFIIIATDINGNTDSKTITVSRKTVESTTVTASLNPENIKSKLSRDAVAVIIGISNYKSLPRADFAKDDAQVFYDYAIRALGVKPESIKLFLDADAEEVEIFKAFKTWLPARVKSTTDVYVFYSGHGLPTSDGLGLYLLPFRADRDLISKTAIQFQEISNDIQATNPNSVTIFMDACYSGQARDGETLIASARPFALKAQTTIFPSAFNVFSASQSDQISSSSPELKHGIFSYYLMKGMEGDADTNRDGKITLGEMQVYLAENVGRQAGMMNRKQKPQLMGDPSRVLVSR